LGYARRAADFISLNSRALLRVLEQAIAIDRYHGPALALAADCHLRLVIDGWAEAPKTNLRKASDLAP
jgi:hypothetical protein